MVFRLLAFLVMLFGFLYVARLVWIKWLKGFLNKEFNSETEDS